MIFELCLLATEAGPATADRAIRGTDEILTLAMPPVLTDPDLLDVHPVTRGFWPFKSGAHETSSEAVLTLKADAAKRLQTARIRGVFAVVIDGEVTGRMIIPQRLQGVELPIAGSFSETEAKTLAQQIRSQRLRDAA